MKTGTDLVSYAESLAAGTWYRLAVLHGRNNLKLYLHGQQIGGWLNLPSKKPPVRILKVAMGEAKPCYFNTGCCQHEDGDVTGIEIEHEVIRLIK